MLLCSCENEMEYHPVSSGDEIILNALLDASQTGHDVMVGLSHIGGVGEAPGSSLECSVNGRRVPVFRADSTSWPNADSYARASRYNMSVFHFDSALKEGDEVRLEASCGGRKASASVVVPAPAIMKGVDTLSVSEYDTDYGYYQFAMGFRVNMTDVSPDEDFYSLEISVDREIALKDSLGNEVASFAASTYCTMDTSDDIILSDGNIAASENTDLFDLNTPNTYGAFQDLEFNGSNVTLKPKIAMYYIGQYIDFWYYLTKLGEEREKVSLGEVSSRLVVKLSHISRRHYYYLKALNTLRGGDADLALEDVSIPDNVEGGIGFVGVSNPVRSSFDLPEMTFDVSEWDYPDWGYPGYYYE